MKNKNILAFAENLQTTDKHQAAGSLARTVMADSHRTVGFCCLGLQSHDLGFVVVNDDGEGGARRPDGSFGALSLAPKELAEWLGFHPGTDEPRTAEYNFTIDWDDNLTMPPDEGGEEIKYRDARSEIDSLAAMNDLLRCNVGAWGKGHAFTFAQIGDVVRHFGLAELTT